MKNQEIDRNTDSQDSGKIPRRTVLKGIAAGVIGAVVGFEAARDPISLFASEKRKVELDHDSMLDRLFERVNSIANERTRTETLEIANSFKRIIHINDSFVRAYEEDLDENGEPRLKVLYGEKYRQLGVNDPESMIFIVNNNRLASEILIKPIQNLLDSEGADVARAIERIKSEIDHDVTSEGEQKYIKGAHVRLKDYLYVDRVRGGVVEVVPNSDIDNQWIETGEDLAEAERFKSQIKTPVIGNLRINPSHDNTGVGESDINASFQEGELFSQIHVNGNWDEYVLNHELGHALDITLNDTQMFRYLSPEAIYKLMVIREEALSSDLWGRKYPDTGQVFTERISKAGQSDGWVTIESGASKNQITPPDGEMIADAAPEIRLKSIRIAGGLKIRMDDYPDGIFYSGLYHGRSIAEGNNWLVRNSDQDIVNEYRNMLENSKSSSLGDFLNGENSIVLDSMGEKSPFLAKTISRLKEIAPLMKNNISWIDSAYTMVGTWEDRKWFDLATTLGQRIAVIEMFREDSEELSLLTEQERADFQHQILYAFCSADNETFANLLALSVCSPDIAEKVPSPYLRYLTALNEELQARGNIIKPGSELIAMVRSHAQEAHT